jgi:hypothetical protein
MKHEDSYLEKGGYDRYGHKWYICHDTCVRMIPDTWDVNHFRVMEEELGNVFETREEAMTVAEEIRLLLKKNIKAPIKKEWIKLTGENYPPIDKETGVSIHVYVTDGTEFGAGSYDFDRQEWTYFMCGKIEENSNDITHYMIPTLS